jgi:hypothetical protein
MTAITSGICDPRNGVQGFSVQGSNPEPLMSALGQKQTSRCEIAMSALPPKADIAERDRNVRFVPFSDSCNAARNYLFDHLVGAGQ